MAGTKRRRGGSSGNKAAAAAAALTTSSGKKSSVFQVLSQLLEITNSKSKSVETLQAFCDGKCFLEKESTKKQPHLDCYWIALSTQIMNRLMTQEKQNTVVVLAAFCDGVSKLLLSDKTKLEKASHGASSRSILARALLTTTVASLYCLQNDDGKSLQALKAAVAALDRIIHLKSDDDDSWSSTNAWNLEDLQERCHGLPLVDVEETCVTSLQAADDSNKSTTATSSPPTKRAARTRRGGKASPAKPIIVDTTALHQAFEQLLQNSNQRIEVRVAVKRWGSMALVWLCQGQLQLLKTTHQVAGHDSSLSASQKSKLMNQMVEIVSEAGDNCGLRPPTGGMDQYLRSIWPNKKSTKKSKLTRVDIRDWATIVIYDLVQVHRQCLQHVSTKVVNELDGVEEKGEGHDDQSAFVAPALSTALSSLCRTAASSVANSTYLEQSEWTKSLTSIAAAQCLQLAVEPELPLDCKITNFALTHLEGCLRLLEPQRSQRAYSAHDVMDDEEDVHEYQKWERLFSLKDPLPTPSESGIKDPDDSSFPLTHVCNFAGVLPSSSTGEFDDEEAVALVIRALYSKSDTDPPAATLVSTLTDIVRRAYDTRKPKDSAEKTDEESTPSKDKKRPARGVGRRNTRRKGDTGEVVVEREEWHRITPQRALIATEALNVLRLCLLIQSNPPSPLRQSIRQTLSSTHIEKILELGELLDKVLVKTRLDAVRLPPGDNEASTSPPDNLFSTESTGGGHANDFTHYEKPLWSAHMTMCQVLGRGHTSFDASLSTQPIFGPDVDREKNYKALAALHNTNIRKVWPLSLPAAHHCFLVANLTREPIDAVEYSAEKYIAKGYIESIGHVLQNLGSLNSNEWKPEHLYLDDEIPLAHRDARTLLVAISRLPLLKQRACVEELIGLTNNALKSIQGNKSKRENLLSNGEASSLVARVVVTCMSLVNVITSGSSVRESLFAHVGSVQINLPPFITSSEWYRCERCFMGIFADWEFPSFPDVSNTSSSMALKEKTMKDLRSILDITFELGFETARKDHCHLLFAAWNGLGQLGATRGPQRISNSHTNRDDFPKKILQLRDDVCFVHKEINQSDHSRTMPASTLKRNLKNMLDKAESIVGTVLDEYVPNGKEMANDVPTSTFALLTALPSYISSSIAGHTKPGNDFFSTTLSKAAARQSKRQRGYSSESDAVHSDGDSVETDGGGYESDVRVDALSRLRECCDAFGTSPIHPDWLDVSCSLREGIRYTDAIDVSEKAIRTLTRLTVAAFSQYKRFYFEAIKAYHQDDKNLDSRVNLCMNLCQWTSHEPAASSLLGPGPYPDDREWKDDIATVCDLQQDVLELLVDESLIKNVEQARESWCPNAAQRLVGRLQDRNRLIGGWETSTAELRAGGEWELLLSEALTISCLDVKDFPVDSESKTEISERAAQRGHEALVKAQLWRTIFMNAASHLMPAAALLRLGLGKVGRKPHPFSFHENNQDPYDVTPLQFSERLNGIVTASPSLKETVFETMCTLARLCAEGDDNLTATCHAIAAHLVVDSKSFSDLEGLQCIRFAFTGLKRIRELAEMSSNEEEIFKVVPFLAERLTSVIEDFGRIPKSKSAQIVDASEEFRRLFSFFVASGARLLDTVVENSVEVFKILTTGNVKEIDEDGIETYQWSDQNRQSLVITDFVSALCGDALRANERTRSCIVLVLSRIADLESRLTFPPKTRYASSVVPGIIDAFNSIDNKRLKTLVLQELCCLSPPPDQALLQDLPSLSYRKDLANLFAFLLSTRGDAKAFNRSKVLFDSLIESFDGWSKLKQEDREHILDLLFLYGCRFNTLNEIGSRLITRASSTSEEDQAGEIEILTKFFGYIRDLQAALVTSSKRKATTTSKESSKNDPNQRRGSSGGGSVHEPTTEHPSSCSFVQKSGFHGQHWYNCYTCGLVWDKGCCTLCALVCHRGHDVSYSRFSSFFCDCGAEDGSAAEQSRVACKCLSSLAADQVGIFFKNEATGNLLEPTPLSPQPGHSQQVNNGITTSIGIEIARDSFNDIALSSIKNFTGNARESPWLDSLFSIVRHQFETWKSAKSTKSNLESLLTDKGRGRDTKPIFRVSHQSLRKSLRNRKARVLDLQRLGEKTMIPARAAKGFQVKMSSDTSTNAHMLSRLSRHEISRSVLAADSRGRMIIAEPCSLVFCSAISAVSIRHVSRPYETPLSRNQMCIVGTASMKFNIVGLRTCAENERHLVVWGTSEACVAVLKPNWDGVEEKIDLIFDINQHDGEGDYLVKCEWIPGSQTHVAVGCSRFVRIYNIARSNSDKRALPVIGYNLGFEASLRDVTIVPYKGYAGVEDGAESGGTFESEKVSKMFLLLENGRLHVVDLKTSPNGRLESPGDQHFEPSECIALGTAGVRPRSGSSIGQPGATTRTLGEGSQLTYLKQSRVLLYKCTSSCVLALMLDTKGDVEGTFELIPHTISSEILGNGPDGYSITGPFTHWTELGVAYRNGAAFFRVACVGRSSRSNQPKLLCIEFNESDVRIKEIVWLSGSSVGLGLSLSASYEGLVAFSAPFIGDASSDSRMLGERVFLCAVTSNGSLLFFGEETVDTIPSQESDDGTESASPLKLVNLSGIAALQTKKPVFPLTLFEKLKNVSDSDDVVFGGESLGSDPDELKSRLSRESSSSLICPKREGCTLTISLRPKSREAEVSRPGDSRPQSKSPQAQIPTGDWVIAAIRILVGSTSNYIPSKIYVQGRPVDLTPRVKKWYSLPLTDEEIALSIRNGLVSIGIGQSFDSSNNIVVDSIEVYAADRKSIESWLPKSYFEAEGTIQSDFYTATQHATTVAPESEGGDSNGLILSARALTFLCELVGSNKLISEGGRVFLRQLIQDTALDRDKKVTECVQALLERLEPNNRSRRSFYDESILFGCSKALDRSKAIVNDSSMMDEDEEKTNPASKWAAVRLVLKDCLQAASSVARERPMNYLQSMENIVENKVSSGSIAVDSSKLILEGFRRSTLYEDLIGGPGGIIDLSLTEMAIELNTDAPHSKQFAKFDVIRGFLESNKAGVVERTCEAISFFCRKHGGVEQPASDAPDLFTLLQHARLVAYQCDSCTLFPMKEIRYTLLEDDYDIDLCKNCYRLGKEFAEAKKFDSNVDVVIAGKAVGGETKLSCAQMRQMQPVSLEKMDVEQVEVQSTSRRGNSPSEASMDEEEELQKALRLSLGETMSQDFQQQSELPIGCQAYEDFVGYLFSSIVELLPSVLKRDRCGHQVGPLIRLLLDLVRHSRHEDAKNDRTKRFAKELAHGVSHILMLGTVQSKLPQDRIITLVTCLRAFTNLLVPEADSQYYMAGSQPDDHGEEQRPTKQKDKTNPQFVCEVHNIPAVRRRCARGPHKDRRFYVCGKERGQRCKYFVWATEIEAKPEEKPKASSHFHDVIKGLLWSHSPTGSLPLHVRLCRLLEDEVFGEEGDECDVSLSMASTSNDKKTKNNPLKSFYSIQDMERDFADGVFCSREKLQDTVSGENAVKTEATGTRELLMPVGTQGDRGALLLEASLDLLTLIADHQTEGISRWFSLLCEINISSNKPSSLRALAKKVLQSLCGGKRSLYHSVRDHFAFGFQLKSLYFHSSPVLVAALIVKEKARQCSVDWARIDNVSWSTIGVGDLIGTDDLISENDYTQMCAKKLGKVLDELWSVINKNRGESWRRFCGLRSLPHSHREIKKSGQGSKHGEAECSLAATSPIVALFWIACALNGTNQVLMFRLVDFALTNWKERKSVHRKSQESSSEGEGANDGNEDEEAMTVAEESLSVPEEILLNGERKLTVDGIVAFAISFVYGGRTLELRRVAFHVIVKLCCKLSAENQGLVFQRLIALPLSELGHMGKTSVEFLNLLQSLCRSFDTSVPVREAADFVMNCFVQQMNAVKYDRSNGEWAVLEYGSGVSTVKKKFDLSPCLYCCRPHHLRIKEPTHKSSERREAASTSRGTSGSNSGGGTRSTSSPTSSRSQSQKKWHTNQVCNYARGRIDNWKDSSASNEFCSFYSLKYRLVVSDIHLTVNDPRGRFVKTITVYFTPRPATEVSRLKSADFEERWQKCATINLPRGASRASASLAQPVLAANMKLEFSDFYERPGGSKASDGSMLVHCPRCTRVVTNAHGVCGNCGEVAFQCRKCRHINYDRLDAFLCVECGYCANGSFSFELTAGVATNAVSISNDRSHERAIKILGAATSIHEELRSALRGRIQAVGSRKKPSAKKEEPDSSFNSPMKRAFLGLPPIHGTGEDSRASKLDRVDKQGSVVKFVARPESSHSSSRSSVAAVDRTRSLLRLARQVRSETGSSSDRRRSSDVIIRQLGRGLAIDHLDDENGLFGLLEGNDVLDSSEPLSRVIASVQSRRRDDAVRSSARENGGDGGSGPSPKKTESGKEVIEDCQKLHMLMREAERERYELNRRIEAWKRLDNGSLAENSAGSAGPMIYSPSHCSVCGPTVALQLLILWLRLFLARPSDVKIDQDFLCLLLEDIPSVSKGLSDCKRQVVREIATKSKDGAQLVLSELRKRLSATNDITSAEILGKIMGVEGFLMAEEYSKLAIEVLAARQASFS